MIVGGQTEARAQLSSTIIDYHEPFDQGFRHSTQFFRGYYSRDAWTAEAIFSKLPEKKWRELHFVCFCFVSYRRCFLHSQPPFCAVGLSFVNRRCLWRCYRCGLSCFLLLGQRASACTFDHLFARLPSLCLEVCLSFVLTLLCRSFNCYWFNRVHPSFI